MRESSPANRRTYRRTVIGTVGTGLVALLAGCSQSRVDGAVATNETPLVFTHEYSTRATYSGTKVVVEVTAENAGSDPITSESRIPEITCTFLDSNDETLYEPSIKLVRPLEVDQSTTLEFTLAIDTDDVSRYELRSRWVEA
jgi:hypothetical protein